MLPFAIQASLLPALTCPLELVGSASTPNQPVLIIAPSAANVWSKWVRYLDSIVVFTIPGYFNITLALRLSRKKEHAAHLKRENEKSARFLQ